MKKRLLCTTMVLIMMITSLLPSQAFAAGKQTPVAAAKNAVVRLLMEDADGNLMTGSAFGVGKSGKAPEYFVTNSHCCLDDSGKPMKKIYILLDSSAVTITSIPVLSPGLSFPLFSIDDVRFDYNRMVECSVVNSSTISLYPDVAVLKAAKPVEGRTTLKLARSGENVQEAQTVHALGYPSDMDDIQAGTFSKNIVATSDDVNFTSGTVMQKMKNVEGFGNMNLISHTAQIAHGNSGGPLLTDDGTVVGINTYQISSQNAGTDGNYYFSVYIDYAREILDAHNIRYESKGFLQADAKTIVLIAAMVLVAALAVFLILFFNRKKRDYQDDLERQEAKQLRLQGTAGVFAGRRFPLDNQVTIGRAPGNSIVFPTTTKGVSGNHCVVINQNGQIYVKDVSSQGTFVNGTKRLPPNQLTSVSVGDRISLGSENEAFMITYKGGRV